MPIWYVKTDHSAHAIYELNVSFTYRRGVVVARSDSNGQSYGLETWSEQRTVSTLFLYLGIRAFKSNFAESGDYRHI